MTKQVIISPEIESVAQKIHEYKETHNEVIPTQSELVSLFTPRKNH
jgi:hypothetical protein